MKINLLTKYTKLLSCVIAILFFNAAIQSQTASSLDFDGIDDNIQIPHFARPVNMTVEGWIKTGSGAVTQIVAWGGSTGNTAEFKISGGLLSYYEWDGTTFPGVSAAITITNNVWHHVAVVRTNSVANNVTLYVDGVVASVGTVNQIITTNALNIGAYDYFGLQQYFSGNIDDIRIWSRALCQAEILNNLNCEIATTGTNLLANYHFNQGTSGAGNPGVTTLNDASGNGNNGTLSNFALSGSSSNWVNPHSLTSGVSCSAYNPEINLVGNGLSIVDGNTAPSLADHTDFGNLGAGGSVVRTFTIQNTGTSTLAVNSITMSGANASLFSVSALSPISPIAAGSFATFSVTFSPTSVGTKTALINISTNDCDESLYDFVLSGNAIVGEALNFDGANDFAMTPVFTTVNNNITLEAKINWAGQTASGKIITYNGNTSSRGYGFYIAPNSSVLQILYGGLVANSANYTLTPGVWTSLSMVIETGKVSCYANGLLTTSISVVNPILPTLADKFTVGSDEAGTGNFNGSIDEVRFWSRALCQSEIQNNLNCEIATTGSSLIANYHFNQGVSSGSNTGVNSILDASGNINHLPLSNFALTGASSNWVAPGAVVSGVSCAAYLDPEINLVGNGTSISNNDLSPSLADHSDFGNACINQVSVRTFTIQNIGTANLAVSSLSISGPSASSFTVGTLSPASPISASSLSTFTVAFSASIIAAYSATVNISSNDCDESVYKFAITGSVMPGPTITPITSNSAICIGNTVTLSGSGANTYTWTGGIIDAVAFSPTTTTSYTVAGTNTVTGCTSTAIKTVTVYSLPNLTITPSSSVICIGSSSTLSASGASTYTWNPGAVISGSFVVSPVSTATYNLLGIDINGCANNITQTIAVNSLPVVTASTTNSIICLNATTTLNGGGASTYTWTGGVANGVPFTPTITTTYTVTGTSIATGCTNTAVKSITINALPSVTANASSSVICIGFTTSLSGSGANSYNWSGGVINSVAFSPTSTTAYTVTGTDIATGCTNTAVQTITVNSLPVVTASTTNSIICIGYTTALNGGGATTYTWTGGVTDAVAFSPTSTTTYTVIGTNAITGCTNTAVKSITVNALPIVTANVTNSIICLGYTTSLSGGGASTYTWTGGVTNAVAFSPTVTGNYTVTGTAAVGGGCTNTAVRSITVNAPPAVTASATNSLVCIGYTTSLIGGGANTYVWTGGVTNATAFSPTITNTYTVTGTSIATGCTNTAIQTITVNSLPIVTASTTNSVICLGYTTSLIGSGASTYSWTGGVTDGSAFSPTATLTYTVTGTASVGAGCYNTAVKSITVNPLPPVIANVTNSVICFGKTTTLSGSGATTYTWTSGVTNGVAFSPTATATYTVAGTLAATGCSNTATKTITVNPLPSLTINIPNANVCLGKSTTITASGANTYTWTGGITNGVGFSPAVNATYTVTATIAATGCTDTAVQSITVNALPVVTASTTNSIICLGYTTSLIGGGASTYTWTSGVIDATAFTPTSTANYTVTGTSAATGCSNTAVKSITVNSLPNVVANVTSSVICFGKNTTLFGTGANSYTWSSGVTNFVSFSPTITATYTVVGTSAITGCTNSAVKSITVNALPPVGANASYSIVCLNFTTSLSGSGANTYTWTGGVLNGVSFTPTTTLNYTVTGTDAATGCTNTAVQSITVNPLPVVTSSTSASVICLNDITSLSGIGADTYVWTNGVTDAVSFSPTATATYSVIGTIAATGCTNSAVRTITVNPLPVVTSTVSNPVVCFGKTTTLVASGATTYSWTNGVINGAAYVPTTTATYTVIGTLASTGCTNTAFQTVTVLPTPIITTSNNSPICNGGPLLLTATSTAVTYTWTGPVGFVSAVQNPTINFAAPNNSGIYTVKAMAVNGCTNYATTQVTTVYPTPALTATGATVCELQPINLSAYSFLAASYEWSGPNTFTSAIQNPTIVSSSPNMTGVYTVTATSVQGCTATAVTNVSVVSLPTPSISSNSPICFGDTLKFSANGGNSYQWFGPNGFYSLSQNTLIANASTLAGGTYSLVSTTGVCVITVTAPLTVNTLPIPIIVNNSPVCERSSIQFSASGGTQYAWSGPLSFTSSVSTVTIAAATFSNAGIYSLTVTDANACHSYTTTTVTILSIPNPTVIGDAVCINQNATLHASGGDSYLWAGPSAFTSTLSAPTISITNSNMAGSYTVTVFKNNGCFLDTTVNLTVNAFSLPSPSISANAKACLNSKINLSGTGGDVYLWKGPASFSSTSQNVSFTATNMNSAGIYTLSVKNSSNCAASTTVLITVYPQPKASLVSTGNNLCIPFCANFKTNSAGNIAPIISYKYDVDGKPITDSLVKYCFGEEGNYLMNVTYKDTNNCANTASLVISAYGKPSAEFDFYPTNPVAGVDDVLFTSNSTGTLQTNWTWYVIKIKPDTLKTQRVNYQFKESGKYPVALIVKNKWGCTDTVIKLVKVDDEFSLFVPSAFTPNADGLNDQFLLYGYSLIDTKLSIFNKWGQKIFYTTDLSVGWDGTFNGESCVPDKYTYKLEYKNLNLKQNTKMGYFFLVR